MRKSQVKEDASNASLWINEIKDRIEIKIESHICSVKALNYSIGWLFFSLCLAHRVEMCGTLNEPLFFIWDLVKKRENKKKHDDFQRSLFDETLCSFQTKKKKSFF